MHAALIIVIVAVVLVYFIISYKPKHEDNLKDLYFEGLDAMVDGRNQQAYENFKKIIAKDTANIKAYIKLGQVAREGGNPDYALKIHKQVSYRKGLSYYEKKELHKNLALDYYALNKIDYAISQCKQILEVDRKNMWALSKLILFYQDKKEWKKSKKYLELKLKYSEKEDSHSLALYKIQEGRVFLSEQKFEDSRTCFNKFVHN